MSDIGIEKARKKFFGTLAKRITCTKCGKSRVKAEFGVRLMNRNDVAKGKKPEFRRQSYCNTCRHEEQ